MKEKMIFLHTGLRHDGPEVNVWDYIKELGQKMQREPALLRVSINELRESYEAGRAVIMTNGESGVGFVRFTLLLTSSLKAKLNLDGEVPEIWEIGSAIIDEQYRGRGLYTELRNNLLKLVSDKVQRESLLVLGTTKNVKVYNILSRAADLKMDFYACCHTEFPMIAPFTCVCSPEFGSGFHLSEGCQTRISEDQIKEIPTIAAENKGKIPCVMYVSSQSLANRTDTSLSRRFTDRNPVSSQRKLVDTLKNLGYY